MGRRGVLSSMPKMVLPTVSWVALMSLLKKAPKNLSAFGPGTGAEMAMKALFGCRAAPQTDSLRYADDYLGARLKRRHGSARKRAKSATMLLPSIMGGCSSRPHTHSFRVHHVVNQEALQLMLTIDDGVDLEQEAFFEAEELCYGIIRDGDRLLHDDLYADDSTQASSSMCTCSSSLSASASRSLTYNSSCIAWSRSSVDSEGFFSTATSASFGHASSSADQLLNVGPHVSCDSRPSSNSMASYWAGASERLTYSNVDLDHDLKSEAGGQAEEQSEPEEEEHLAPHNVEVEADHHHLCAQEDQKDSQTSTSGAAEYATHKVGHKSYEDDDEPVNYKGDADREEEAEKSEIVAEMCYSEDPFEDFAEAISRIVVQQQLNEAAQLQELYWRFLRLNAPRHHHTITLAFLHALQRLASAEPHFLHTLL